MVKKKTTTLPVAWNQETQLSPSAVSRDLFIDLISFIYGVCGSEITSLDLTAMDMSHHYCCWGALLFYSTSSKQKPTSALYHQKAQGTASRHMCSSSRQDFFLSLLSEEFQHPKSKSCLAGFEMEEMTETMWPFSQHLCFLLVLLTASSQECNEFLQLQHHVTELNVVKWSAWSWVTYLSVCVCAWEGERVCGHALPGLYRHILALNQQYEDMIWG